MTSDNQLSDRELEILRLVATGASNKEIAHKLYISTNTVKVHLRNIFAKIGVSSRTEAAMYAVSIGLGAGDMKPVTPVQEQSSDQLNLAQAPPKVGGTTLFPAKWIPWVAGVVIISIALIITLLRIYSVSNPDINIVQAPGLSPSGWKTLSPLPQPRYGLALVAYEDRLFAIGGMAESGISSQVDVYKIATNSWVAGKAKPLAVQDIQAVVINGKIYVPGGLTSTGEVTSRLDIYDPRVDSWQQGAQVPIAVSAYALAAYNGHLYLFGGWDGKEIKNEVYKYDPRLDQWSVMPSMPTARRYLGAAVSGTAIFVLGGEDEVGPLNATEIFLPDKTEDQKSAWQPGEPLPNPVSGMGVTSIADIIYLVAGQSDSQRKFSVLAYDKNQGWRAIEDWPGESPTYLGLTNLGVYIYAVGGLVAEIPSETSLNFQALYTISFPLISK